MGSIKGTIKNVGTVETKGEFKFRKLVLNTGGDYPQILSIDFTQKNCDLLNNYNEGQDVEVQYNLRGREWTNPQGKTVIFNTIQGWKIDTATEGVSTSQQAPDRADLPF